MCRKGYFSGSAFFAAANSVFRPSRRARVVGTQIREKFLIIEIKHPGVARFAICLSLRIEQIAAKHVFVTWKRSRLRRTALAENIVRISRFLRFFDDALVVLG